MRERSFINLPITVSQAQIQEMLKSHFPADGRLYWHDDNHDKDVHIRLTSVPTVNFGINQITVVAPINIWVRKYSSGIGVFRISKSADTNINVTFNVSLNVSLNVSSDYTIDASINGEFNWSTRPIIHILGIRINLTNRVAPAITKKVNSLALTLQEKLRTRLNEFRSKIETLCRKIQDPIRIEDEIYLLVRPSHLRVAPFRPDGGNLVWDLSLSSETIVTSDLETTLAECPVSSLPILTTGMTSSLGQFQLKVSSYLTFEVISNKLTEFLVDKSYSLTRPFSLDFTINRVNLEKDETTGKVSVLLQVSNEEGEGELKFMGLPKYDRINNKIYFNSFDVIFNFPGASGSFNFTRISGGEISLVADLFEKLTFELDRPLEKIRSKLNEKLSALGLIDGASITSEVDSINSFSLDVSGERIITSVSINGSCEVTVDQLTEEMNTDRCFTM